ncbi:hypothetical protein RB595_009187 [Gaeumannomyces hyphopodioides]
MINYRLGVLSQGPWGGDCQINYVRSRHSVNPYDITLDIMESPDGTCFVELAVQEALYPRGAAIKMLDMYCLLLDTACKDPSRLISDLVEEGFGAIRGSNTVAVPPATTALAPGPSIAPRLETSTWAETIPAQVHAMTGLHANEIAVKDGWRELSYSDLTREVNGISIALQKRFPHATIESRSSGLEYTDGNPNALFCLLFQPSADYVTSILGVLNIPAAAIPLDTRLRRERLAEMVKDCRPLAILHHGATADLAAWLAASCGDMIVGTLDVSQLQRSDSKASNTSRSATAITPTAVYYTSGTTDAPKGAIQTHGGLCSIVASFTRRVNTDSRHTVLQQAAFGFDLSLLQILITLCTGSRLVVATAEQRLDPESLASLAAKEDVTLIAATPTEFGILLHHATFLHSEEARGGRDKRMSVFNMYGPTETSILSSVGLVEYWAVEQPKAGEGNFDGMIGVGPPVDGAQIYVIGKSGERLGPGSPGEVKIRGIRIELEDVSSTIVAAGSGRILHAVTTVRGDSKVIVSFAILAQLTDSARAGIDDDEAFLESLPGSLPLPEYMRPAAIIPIGQLPTTHRGKIDTAALDRIHLPIHGSRAVVTASPKVDVAPIKTPVNCSGDSLLSALESDLLSTWKQVLPDAARQTLGGSTDAGPDTDFFRLGGNSMTLVTLRSAIRRRWTVELSLLRMFEASTLRLMAADLREAKNAQAGDGVDWDRSWPVRQQRKCRKTILLTGAHTPLGSQLLKLILARNDVAKVHCLAVSSEYAAELARTANLGRSQSDKLIVHEGDLGSPSLGLSQADIEVLIGSVDVIVHAGAQGSCLNSYASIRDPNVGSTSFLAALGLAASQRRPTRFHLVSSARVILFSGKHEYPEASMSRFYPPAAVTNQQGQKTKHKSREGFTTTKWASERLLENCAAADGDRQGRMLVTVHRSGYLMSESADEMDAINMLHRFTGRLGAVPAMDDFSGSPDICKLEWAAARIADDVLADGGGGGAQGTTTGVKYVHHTMDNAIPIQQFQAHMEEELGRPLQRLEMMEWTARVEEAGMSPFLVAFLRAVCEMGEARYPRLLLGSGMGKGEELRISATSLVTEGRGSLSVWTPNY